MLSELAPRPARLRLRPAGSASRVSPSTSPLSSPRGDRYPMMADRVRGLPSPPAAAPSSRASRPARGLAWYSGAPGLVGRQLRPPARSRSRASPRPPLCARPRARPRSAGPAAVRTTMPSKMFSRTLSSTWSTVPIAVPSARAHLDAALERLVGDRQVCGVAGHGLRSGGRRRPASSRSRPAAPRSRTRRASPWRSAGKSGRVMPNDGDEHRPRGQQRRPRRRTGPCWARDSSAARMRRPRCCIGRRAYRTAAAASVRSRSGSPWPRPGPGSGCPAPRDP